MIMDRPEGKPAGLNVARLDPGGGDTGENRLAGDAHRGERFPGRSGLFADAKGDIGDVGNRQNPTFPGSR